jgi:hypothetical protein
MFTPSENENESTPGDPKNIPVEDDAAGGGPNNVSGFRSVVV